MSLRPGAWLGQAVFHALFMLLIAWLSLRPVYEHLPPDQAMIKLSFSHAGRLIADCRTYTPEEIAAMPPNMRKAQDCPRERQPVQIELWLDDAVLFETALQPSGLWRDGSATIYRKFAVPAGEHRLSARLSDHADAVEPDYRKDAIVNLAPRRNFVIDFNVEKDGFHFQ
jgi:hypothetical protein